ncbi:MAG: hypothetical protein Q3972_07875 [Corynebacterium sp.]|nr:hypothetical protein [Corynebacterium sp.]
MSKSRTVHYARTIIASTLSLSLVAGMIIADSNNTTSTATAGTVTASPLTTLQAAEDEVSTSASTSASTTTTTPSASGATVTTVSVTSSPAPTSFTATGEPSVPTDLAEVGYRSEARLGFLARTIHALWNIVYNLLPLKFFTSWLRMDTSDARGLFDSWVKAEQDQYCQDVADGKYTLEQQLTIGWEQYNVGLDGCRDGKVADGRSRNILDWFMAWWRLIF